MSSTARAGICYSGVQGHISTPAEQTPQCFKCMTNLNMHPNANQRVQMWITSNFTVSLQTQLFIQCTVLTVQAWEVLGKAVGRLYVCHQLPADMLFAAFGFILLVNSCQTVRHNRKTSANSIQDPVWQKGLKTGLYAIVLNIALVLQMFTCNYSMSIKLLLPFLKAVMHVCYLCYQ